jgi:peptidyl-prolyl cis-trans isomerase C
LLPDDFDMPILVNDQLIDDQTIRDEAGFLKERLKLEMPSEDSLSLELRAREWARENVIERVLLQQAAGALSSEELIDNVTRKLARPKAQEVAAYYREFKSSFYLPESIRAAHIVKNVDEAATEEQAAAAIREIDLALKNGADFAELANRCSDCPWRGGDLGFFGRGDMVEEFEAVVFSLRPGETSAVFRSPFGFHIARLLERHPAGYRSLNEVRGEIEGQLLNQKKQQAVYEFIDSLRARAEIRKV